MIFNQSDFLPDGQTGFVHPGELPGSVFNHRGNPVAADPNFARALRFNNKSKRSQVVGVLAERDT